MTVSIAELNSRVFQGVPLAAEYLELDAIHNIVVQKVNVRTQQSRMSDIHVLLRTSAEFTPAASPYDVTELIGKGVPAWVETQANPIEQTDWWRPLRIVPLVQLNDYSLMGTLACSFEGQERDPADPDFDTEEAPAIQYLYFSFIPNAPCRIRFDSDNMRVLSTGEILLPDNLSELIVLDAEETVIERVKVGIAERCRIDPELRKDARMLLETLNDLKVQLREDKRPLVGLWEVWAFRDRNAEGAFTKPTPSGRAMYGPSSDY